MTPQPSRLVFEITEPRTLTAVGIIDSHTADTLLEHIHELGTDDDVTLDLAQVTFIDSSGLRSLVTSHQELEAEGQRLVLRETSEAVRRLLEITGLLDHLHTD